MFRLYGNSKEIETMIDTTNVQAAHTLRLEKNVRATPEAAYDAFLEPEHLSKWFTTEARADLRVGGSYSNADNDHGEFTVLERPHRLSFTWENAEHSPGTLVTVSFTLSADDTTTITLEHARLASQHDLTDMFGGWSWALDSVKSYLEKGHGITHAEWLGLN